MTAPDMTKVLMLDDVDLSVEAPFIGPDHAVAVAGYVNGASIPANWPAIVQKWGKSGLHLVSIDVQANPSAGAQCLDIESGDAVISQAPGWTRATQAGGIAAKDLRVWPKLYISVGSAAELVSTMTGAGLKQGINYLLWTAHYTGIPHICAPESCGATVRADATQWTSKDHGADLDASLCYAYFFAGVGGVVNVWGSKPPKPPVPPVTTQPVSWELWPSGQLLVEGDIGDPVRVLQTALRDSRIPGVRGIPVDGNFGPGTKTALGNFQAEAALLEDYEAGDQTRAHLMALGDVPMKPVVPPVTPPPPPAPTPPPPPPPPPAPVPPPPPPVIQEWVLDVNISALAIPVEGTLTAPGYAPLVLPAGTFIVLK